VSDYWTYDAGEIDAHPELAAITILDTAVHETTKALIAANPDLKHFPVNLARRRYMRPAMHQLWALLRTAASLRESIAAYVQRVTDKGPFDDLPF
jgi:hypothetical protein